MRIAVLVICLVLGTRAAADTHGSPVEQLHQEINALRAGQGLTAVTRHPALRRAATGHAADMIARRYFDHRSPDGLGVADRVTAAGYAYQRVGETLAVGTVSAAETVDGWRRSPSHAAILLSPRFDTVGLAYLAGPLQYRGTVMRHVWVAVFARERDHRD